MRPHDHAIPHYSPRTRPAKTSGVTPALIVGLVAAAVIVPAAGIAIYRAAVVGKPIHVHNDRDVAATIAIGERTWDVAPNAWVGANVPPDSEPRMRVSYADGTADAIDVLGGGKDCYREYRAYSLGAKACYAMLDVSAAYGKGDAVTVEHTYRGRQDLDFGVARFRCEDSDAIERFGVEPVDVKYLDPGEPLPEKVYLGSTERAFRLFEVPCTEGAAAALAAELSGKT